jgi:hypothetical protein
MRAVEEEGRSEKSGTEAFQTTGDKTKNPVRGMNGRDSHCKAIIS